jgi:hypothetical protein
MTVFAEQLRPGMIVRTARETTYEVIDVLPQPHSEGRKLLRWRWIDIDNGEQRGPVREAVVSIHDMKTPWGSEIIAERQHIIEEF